MKLFSALLLLALVASAAAETYYISPFGSDSNTGTEQSPWATLSKALGAANDNDVITVLTGLYAGNGNCGLTIDKVLKLYGPAGSVGTFFSCPSGTGINLNTTHIEIEGITWTGSNPGIDASNGAIVNATDLGLSGNSRGIYSSYKSSSLPGVVWINGLTMSCSNGYGIYTEGTKLVVNGAIITGDCSPAFSLDYATSSAPPLQVTISNAQMSGGTAFLDTSSSSYLNANVDVKDSVIKNTYHSSSGALTSRGNVAIKGQNLLFQNNVGSGSSSPGAVYVIGSGASFYCVNCTFIQNSFTYGTSTSYYGGAAIRAVDGILQLSSCLFDNNQSNAGGGAITLYNLQGANIQSTVFSNNSAKYYGAAVYCGGTSSNIFQSTFTNNTAQYDDSFYCGSGCFLFTSGTTVDGDPAQGCL